MDIPNIPGLDFHPTDDELLTYYLKQRILDHFEDPSRSVHSHTVPDIDLYGMHPKQLPRHIKRLAHVKSNGREWVFFCARKEKYRNSSRSDRTVPDIGYWKITSKPKEVKSEATGNTIGSKNILTFYEGRNSKGIKSDWILHEYHLNARCLGYYDNTEMPFVVCRLHCKGHNLEELACEDDSTGCVTSETYATTYQQHTSSQEEMWESLPPIQQLPNSLPDYGVGNFDGSGAEYFYSGEAGSSFGGYYNGNDSDFYHPSSGEPSYYQQSQGGWNPHYY